MVEVMENNQSSRHTLLIQKLLVSIHYLTLFRDEIVLVEKMPSLLGETFSPFVIQEELGQILAAVDALSKQERLIKSTFWYDEVSFKLMNRSLDIVGGIDEVLETCESKSVFQAILGDKRPHVFGILIDVFTSIRITNLSIKEESDYPILLNPLERINYQEQEEKKHALLAKIDALIPPSTEETVEDDRDFSSDLLKDSAINVIKQFRHYLFDNKGMVYVIDAKDQLQREISLYNVFDRFKGSFDQIPNALVLVEEILEKLEERDEETFDDEGNLTSEPTESIYLLIYGQNVLIKDSRFESLLAELKHFSNRSDLHVFSYQAYTEDEKNN